MLVNQMVPQMVSIVAGIRAIVAEERLLFLAFDFFVPPQVPLLQIRLAASLAAVQLGA